MAKLTGIFSMLLKPILTFVPWYRDGQQPSDGVHEHRHRLRHKHSAWISIDYLAYSSKIRHWNSSFKVILSLLTIILCIVLNNVYVSVFVILAMAYLVIKVGGLALHDYLTVLTVPLAFILISILAIIIDFSDQPIGRYHLYLGFGYLYTTTAMLKSGVFLMLKIIAAISGLQLMILTTPSSEIIAVMKRMHLPKDFIALMNMIYRYIFILLEVFAQIKNAAESRLGYRNLKTAFSTFGSIAGNILVLSLKKSGAYYDAMEARCYDGALLFLEDDKPIEFRFIVSAALYLLCLLLLWFLTR
jgi:cobalt/nickel transport system permease protein